MKIQFIYALICPIDSTIKYIGKTTDLTVRLQGHLNYALKRDHLQGKHKWLRDLNSQNLKPIVKILEECTNENWQEREIYWIDFYRSITILFNKTHGGEDFVFRSGNNPWNKGGGMYSEESKKKMSDSKLGLTLEESHKNKISQSLLGKSKSSEHILNMRKGHGRKVQQWSLEGELIAEFDAATFAAESIGCKRESIRDACNGKIKICKGFKWTFKT